MKNKECGGQLITDYYLKNVPPYNNTVFYELNCLMNYLSKLKFLALTSERFIPEMILIFDILNSP